MRVAGERIIIFGDSLSKHGVDNSPEIWDVNVGSNRVSSAPGDLLASLLAEQGAQAVRVNARVGRSAWNFWTRENTAALIQSDLAFKPTKVVMMLGSNDVGMGLIADEQAMIKLRDAYQGMGAEVWAVGPFSNTGLARDGVDGVAKMMRRVFGSHFVDGRPLSAVIQPGPDRLHYDQISARALASSIASAIASKISATTIWQSIGLGAAGVGLVFLASAGVKRFKRSSLGATHRPSRDSIDELLQDPDPSSMEIVQDALLQRGDKISEISKISGEVSPSTYSRHRLALHDNARIEWRVTQNGTGRCLAQFNVFDGNGTRVKDPSRPDSGEAYSGAGVFEESYYGAGKFCERAAAAEAWAMAKALKETNEEPPDRIYHAVFSAFGRDNSKPEELYGLAAQSPRHQGLDAKREIVKLLRERDPEMRAVARDLALENEMIHTATVVSIEPIAGYNRTVTKVTLDNGEVFGAHLDVPRIRVGQPLDYVAGRSGWISDSGGGYLRQLHPAGVFNSDHAWPESILKKYVNTWWPDDGTPDLHGAPSDNDPVEQHVALRVGQRFDYIGQTFEIIKIFRDKPRTVQIARRVKDAFGKESLIDHRTFPMRDFDRQHLRALDGVNIVDGKRHTGSEASLIRSGYKPAACASGLDKKGLAKCWKKELVRAFESLDGPRISTKDPRTLTAAQLNKELDKLSAERSKINDELIAAGRGHETANETRQKTDPLALAWRDLSDRYSALRTEIELRYGPGAPSRLPIKRGWWGPRLDGSNDGYRVAYGLVTRRDGKVVTVRAIVDAPRPLTLAEAEAWRRKWGRSSTAWVETMDGQHVPVKGAKRPGSFVDDARPGDVHATMTMRG